MGRDRAARQGSAENDPVSGLKAQFHARRCFSQADFIYHDAGSSNDS